MKYSHPPRTDKLQINLARMFFVVIVFILVTAFLTITISSKDPTWFIPGFVDVPVRVTVYHDGQQTDYFPSDPGFAELAEGVRASLNAGVARPSTIGLSQGSLDDAYKLYVSVEAFFATKVKLHTWFNTGDPTQMLFLITGRHSQEDLVFMGDGKAYLPGPPALVTRKPLLDALQQLGYKITE